MSKTIYGYGIEVSQLTVPVGLQLAFIKKYLPEKHKSLQEDLQEVRSQQGLDHPESYAQFCKHWIDTYQSNTGYEGFWTFFEAAINRHEAGFYVEYLTTEYGEEVVMYEERMPWNISERVKNMKEKDMADIFRKYLADLDLEDVKVGPQEAGL